MKKVLSIAAALLFAVSMAAAQAALNNDSIIKMAKAGLSDDVIVATVNASAGSYTTNPDVLISLKKAGVSDKVIAVLVQHGTPVAAPAPDGGNGNADSQPTGAPAPLPAKPRVFLAAQNTATTFGTVFHNQAAEMSKDFGQSCPTAIVTVNQQNADYTLTLNHVETGFYRDNQMSTSDRNGDVIANPVKFESIANGVKRACAAIAADWASKAPAAQ